MFARIRARSRSRSRTGATSENGTEGTISASPQRVERWSLFHRRKKPETAVGGPVYEDPKDVDNTYDMTMLYEPPNTGAVDLVFVHGLGGGSRKTWSKNRDLNLCWPEKWLGPDLEDKARIFTYGYNSSFLSTEDNHANVMDFAQKLLFHLSSSEFKPRLGTRPIIFVVHSMGGLVVKQTYILAKADPRYLKIVPNIFGMVFLATPHRGSDYGVTLAKIISASPFHSQKKFVDDLSRNSYALQVINEQFRHFVEELKIASFIETKGTPVFGGKSIAIVNKDSGTLGYPSEIVVPLNEDHHTVCKFPSKDYPAYRAVMGTIREFVEECDPTQALQEQAILLATRTAEEELDIARNLLGVRKGAEDDLVWYRSRRLEDTCTWILERDFLIQWREPSNSLSISWLNGSPAFGKSVLTATIVDMIQSEQKPCVFYFFRNGDKLKQNQDSLVRSFTYQLAMVYPKARDYLCTLHRQNYNLANARGYYLWYKVLHPLLSELNLTSPVYWVIDALDEADDPTELLSWIQALPHDIPIKILITSRVTSPISVAFSKIKVHHRFHSYSITETDTLPDIQKYVEQELVNAPANALMKEEILQQVMDKCSGSFLWAKLVIEEIIDCGHTEAEVRNTLRRFPPGMEAIYKRGLEGLDNLSAKNRRLAKQLLIWNLTAIRPLNLEELQDVLLEEFGQFLSLPKAIQQVCGQFLVVDGEKKVQFIHKTARDFLLSSTDPEFSFTPEEDHIYVATTCLEYISQSMKTLAPRLRSGTTVRTATETLIPTFFEYAVFAWHEHLEQAGPGSIEFLRTLKEFMNKYFLAWGAYISWNGNFKQFSTACQGLQNFHRKLLAHGKEDTSIKLWAQDINRMLPEFGSSILFQPSSLLVSVPSLCPRKSVIHGQPSNISLTGENSYNWNDYITHVKVGFEVSTSHIACSSDLVAVVSNGVVACWDTFTFKKNSEFDIAGVLTGIAFNIDGTKLIMATKTSHLAFLNIKSQETSNSFDRAGISGMKKPDISVGGSIDCVNSGLVVSGMKLHTILTNGTSDKIKIAATLSESRTLTSSMFHGMITKIKMDSTQILKTCNSKFIFALWESKTGYLIDNPPNAWLIPLDGKRRPDFSEQDGYGELFASAVAFDNKNHYVYAYCKQTNILLKWDHNRRQGFQAIVKHDLKDLVGSPNGEILAGSTYNGQIILWSGDTMELLSTLHCPKKQIKDMCFSPDSNRLYVLHGDTYSVWGLDKELLPLNNDTDSTITQSHRANRVFNNTEYEPPKIVTMACGNNGEFIVCALEDGTLIIYSAITGDRLKRQRPRTQGAVVRIPHGRISSIVLGSISKHIAYTASCEEDGDSPPYLDYLSEITFDKDDEGNYLGYSLAPISMEFEPRKVPGMLVFGKDETHLLHTSDTTLFMSSIADGSIIRKLALNEAAALRLENLGPWGKFPQLIHYQVPSPLAKGDRWGRQIFTSQDLRYIVASVMEKPSHGVASTTFSLTINVYSPNSHVPPLPQKTITLPNTYAILGMHHSRLIFLSTSLWISSFDLKKFESSGGVFQGCYRHFCLPQSWVAEQTLESLMELCKITPVGGAFVYVKRPASDGRGGGLVLVGRGLEVGKWEAVTE